MKFSWKLSAAVVLITSGAIGVVVNPWTRGHVVEVWKQLSHAGSHSEETLPDKSWQISPGQESKGPRDRTVSLNAAEIRAIGLKTEIVKQQTEPTVLPLFGNTDYDPAYVTVVRTQFDSRVDQVLVDLGMPVKKGDPLLELFSTDLAEAKSNYEAANSQWARDKRVLDYKSELASKNALPGTQVIEAENDEAQSRLKMKLARDKLLVYGLTDKEIESASKEDGVQKAKMILRSRADGVVVLRNVVKGNYYTAADLLMTIAPLDHLWVRGSVSELDAEKVKVGQALKVVFPFSERTIAGTVKYVDKAIDPDSRSAKFRTSIENPGGALKAGMFVRVLVEIPPTKGRTVIPRSAMVTVDRFDYVFIKRPGKANQFDRRQIFTAKESHDVVIVAEPSPDHPGLTPGQEVVTTGSLILNQLYEDKEMTEGGFLVSRDGQKSVATLDPPSLSVVTSPPESR
jgi:cobalt-zinc-cadmium efflux system membrane fusion protein